MFPLCCFLAVLFPFCFSPFDLKASVPEAGQTGGDLATCIPLLGFSKSSVASRAFRKAAEGLFLRVSGDRTCLGVFWRPGSVEGRLMNRKERFPLWQDKPVASYLSWICNLIGPWTGWRGEPKPTSWSSIRLSARSCTWTAAILNTDPG